MLGSNIVYSIDIIIPLRRVSSVKRHNTTQSIQVAIPSCVSKLSFNVSGVTTSISLTVCLKLRTWSTFGVLTLGVLRGYG